MQTISLNPLIFATLNVMISPLILFALSSDFTPTSEYARREVQGFQIYIHPNLKEHPAERDQMVSMLDEKLKEIHKIVPKAAVSKLKTTKIWISWESKSSVAAVYHPSAAWLAQHKFNPDMEKSVELGNAKNVLNWTKLNQPYMVLHELAHAYHHQHVGYGDKSIKAAYEAAVASGKYDDVEMKPQGRGKHYGMNNEMEFFAELSESYFGLNDFQPFTRSDLKSFDPQAYAAVEAAWGIKKVE